MMADVDITSLSVEISAESQGAELNINKLANAIANTGKPPAVTFKYNSHQHTSKGSVPGISGNVDLNVTTVNYPKIICKKGLTRLREGA